MSSEAEKPRGSAGARAAADTASGIVSFVRRKIRASTIATLSNSEALADVTEWIPTGIPGLDEVLGGGWAVGRASEVFGETGSGKSALAHLAIRECQRMGGVAVLLDFETALDKSKMKQLGIDSEALIYDVPEHLEAGWETVWAILDRVEEKPPEKPLLIVWDSIAASVPKEELEVATDKSVIGLQARGMSRGCRRMFRRISNLRAHMLWVNQERTKIGAYSPYGPVKESSGGDGPKYAASQRVRCMRVKTLKDAAKQRATGYLIRSTVRKNRLAAPECSVAWVIDFKQGPSADLTIFEELRSSGVVKMRGGKYRAPWEPETAFSRAEWSVLMRRVAFAAGAKKRYLEVVMGGGAKAVQAAAAAEEDDEPV